MENRNWVELPIKDVAVKLTSGGTPSTKKSEYYENGDIPWLNTKEVDYNRITSTEKYITEEGLKNSSAKWIEENSVIVAMYGATAAKTAITKIPLTTNQACCNIIVNHEVCDYEFLFYNISNKYSELENIAVGAAQQNLSVGVIGNFILKFPPLPEQKAIASILSSLDDKIDLLHQQNQTLEALAETLFRQWFIERRPELVEGEAKEDWEEVSLGSIIDLVVDNRGKTPPTVDYKTEYPLIEVNAINTSDCLVNYNVIRKYVVEETYNTWFRKHLKVNDVIVSTVGTIGVFSIFTSNIGCIAQNLIGLRSDNISSYFIYLFLKINKEDILNLDIGGVQPSIKVPHLLDLKLKKPNIEVINKFHNIVKDYFNKIGENQQQIQTLTQMRDTLLPKLMSGEVRVKM